MLGLTGLNLALSYSPLPESLWYFSYETSLKLMCYNYDNFLLVWYHQSAADMPLTFCATLSGWWMNRKVFTQLHSLMKSTFLLRKPFGGYEINKIMPTPLLPCGIYPLVFNLWDIMLKTPRNILYVHIPMCYSLFGSHVVSLQVVLETEVTNTAALRLYENLGFVRDKRLFRYYLNGVDALRLKLWLRWGRYFEFFTVLIFFFFFCFGSCIQWKSVCFLSKMSG